MSQVSKKKLKQATLSFAVSSPAKKRKREDDESLEEETKNRKTCDFADIKSNEAVDLKDSDTNETSVGDEIPATTGGSPLEPLNTEALDDRRMDVDDSVEQPRVPVVPDNCDIPKTEVPSSAESTNAVETGSPNVSQQSENIEKPRNEPESKPSPNKTSNSSHIKKLTPKQLLKKQEAEARRLEREKLKQEKEQKRLEEKEAKERKRLAEIEAKNEEKRQKEEEKRQKEEEKRQKEEEKRQKEEERRIKEEEKRKQREAEKKAKEEEKQKKIEEIRLKEEQEKRIKEKEAAHFKNFFKRKTNVPKTPAENCSSAVNSLFMPFEVKEDMKLATIVRATLTPERKDHLDTVLQENAQVDKSGLYLAQLKSEEYKIGHSENTCPSNLNDDDDIKDGNEMRTRYRCKLLQFSENRRPAYWGTWRKRSKSISGRTPFKCDSKYFEYDVDSDEEWVEEPGESLHGSDDEKESDHEYEVDNDFFVPHGYLSDEEAPQDEEGNDQTKKLDLLKNEFEAELKEKTCKIKSRFYGCTWLANDVEKGATDVESLLLLFRGICNFNLAPFSWKPDAENVTGNSSAQNTPSLKGKLRAEFPEQFLPDFIRLMHGNKNSAKNLIIEFSAYVLTKQSELNLSQGCIRRKLREVAQWNPTKAVWHVSDEIRQKYGLEDLSALENKWDYVTSVCPQKKISKPSNNVEMSQITTNVPQPLAPTPTTPKHSSITKFVKVLTPEERERQLRNAAVEKSVESTKIVSSSPKITQFLSRPKDPNAIEQPIKKRAILFSVPKEGNQITVESVKNTSTENATITTTSVSSAVVSSSSTDSHITCANPVIKAILDNNVNSTLANNARFETSFAVNDKLDEVSSETTLSKTCPQRTTTPDKETQSVQKKLSNDTVTIKQGKKYATLIPIKKAKE